MKYSYISLGILSFILLGCSSDKHEIAVDEHRQIIENCNIHLERSYEIGTDIEDMSPEQFDELQMMNDHVLAVKSKNVNFLRPNTSHLKNKADVEFSSDHESELFDCIQNLERQIKKSASSI